ncbi:ribonuclease HI [Alteromonas australica]|uniref:ribonuclease HI n=1 Tax=Alteromonas australica TaxID=589873 RepID=UPI0035C7E60C
MNSNNDSTIYANTDGSCRGNPGKGAWAFTLSRTDEHGNQKRLERSGVVKQTTNNQMELMAAIKALEAVKATHPDKPVVVITDSKYVKDGITSWIDGWKKRGWRTASKQPVKNAELWKQLDQLNQSLNVNWEWVKGHSGHLENSEVDRLAKSAASSI